MQDATLKAGLQFAAGNAADQLVSAAVAGLVKGGLRTMLGVKVKLMTAVVLVVTTITSAGVLGRGPGADQSAGGAAAPPAAREYIPVDLFQDITENSGVHFTYHNGEEAEQYTMLETLGGVRPS